MDLSTKYLGLDLPHPLMPGASPLSQDIDSVQRLDPALNVVGLVGHCAIRYQVMGERALGDEALALWHKDDDVRGVDCVVLPGGFSYGDYLRPGAIARCAPIMASAGTAT